MIGSHRLLKSSDFLDCRRYKRKKSKMSDIKVDVSSITPEAQYQLAKGCLEFYFSIVSQPGGRERLDAWKAEHLRKETRT